MNITPTTRRRFLGLLTSLAVAPLAAKAAVTTASPTAKLAAVDAKLAASARDLSEAFARAGGAAGQAGVSFDELIAHVAKAQRTTGRGGAVIGNALKTLYTRAARADVQKQLRKHGVDSMVLRLRLANGEATLQAVADCWPRLTPTQQTHVAEILGGVYQINVTRAIFA